MYVCTQVSRLLFVVVACVCCVCVIVVVTSVFANILCSLITNRTPTMRTHFPYQNHTHTHTRMHSSSRLWSEAKLTCCHNAQRVTHQLLASLPTRQIVPLCSWPKCGCTIVTHAKRKRLAACPCNGGALLVTRVVRRRFAYPALKI